MKKQRGFTLVELLVVISIIAVLMSILLPSLKKARTQAKLKVCSSQQRQIAMASLMYAQSEGQLPPSICQNFCADVRGRFWAKPSWINYHANEDCNNNGGAVWPYLGRILPAPEIFICPLSPGMPKTMDDTYEAADTLYLHGSFYLLWNYEGFEQDGFFGPKNMEDQRGGPEGHHKLPTSDRLLICDRLDINDPEPDNAWDSAHPFVNAKREQALTNSMYTQELIGGEDPIANVPKIVRNAGYLDGHVEPFTSEQSVALTRRKPASAITFLPRRAVREYSTDTVQD